MEIHNIRLPKDSTVADLLDDLRVKVIMGLIMLVHRINISLGCIHIPKLEFLSSSTLDNSFGVSFNHIARCSGSAVSSRCRTQIAGSIHQQDLQGLRLLISSHSSFISLC